MNYSRFRVHDSNVRCCLVIALSHTRTLAHLVFYPVFMHVMLVCAVPRYYRGTIFLRHGTTEYRGIFSRYLPWRKISVTAQHYVLRILCNLYDLFKNRQLSGVVFLDWKFVI